MPQEKNVLKNASTKTLKHIYREWKYSIIIKYKKATNVCKESNILD